METFSSVHSSGADPEALRRMLADHAGHEPASVFRALLLPRLARVAFVVWILGWPIHLIPHAALWVALAILALAAMLT